MKNHVFGHCSTSNSKLYELVVPIKINIFGALFVKFMVKPRLNRLSKVQYSNVQWLQIKNNYFWWTMNDDDCNDDTQLHDLWACNIL